jgi:nicotinate phosphoribosyltransferase
MVNDAPIIEFLLDTDFYKFTMGQFVLGPLNDAKSFGENETIRYGMTCRTKAARLAELVDEGELREQLDHIRTLKFWPDELEFLKGTKLFGPDFLGFLEGLRLPAPTVERLGDGYRIEVEGAWSQSILWETYVLSIVNELYARGLVRARGLDPDALWLEGDQRLSVKIARLKQTEAKLIEFGTRRRHSREWQEHVVNVMSGKLPRQLAGSSNVALAKRYGLKPIGTMAHEIFMVKAAMADTDRALRDSQKEVLDLWRQYHGDALSIALSDTYGLDAFLTDFSGFRARNWHGVRHDSGDPIAFGERIIKFYHSEGINPKTKSIVFSDGLDVEAIMTLQARFAERIDLSFGWGTDLTNDVGLPTLSLVMKVIMAGGRPTVKLSDEPGKHSGPPEEITRYLRVFR